MPLAGNKKRKCGPINFILIVGTRTGRALDCRNENKGIGSHFAIARA